MMTRRFATSTEPGARRRPAAAPLALAVTLLAGCATVGMPPAGGPNAPAAPTGPTAPSLGLFSKIKVPDGQVPVLKLAARGVQVFRCEARGAESAWVFRVPEADLLDDSGKVVGRHGANFSFEHADGSRLIGKVQSYDEAPSRTDLRWLLLSTTAYGKGVLDGVTYVQRINTKGGMPPANCEAKQRNQLLRVDFSSDFVFYRPG
jgi:hypothetical protein